jgi:dTMP kinase
VLCDRFTDASFAYQGGGPRLRPRGAGAAGAWVQQGRQPDLTLWFDLPAAQAAERRAAVRAPDRFESQDLAFFERVRAATPRVQRPPALSALDALGEPRHRLGPVCRRPGRGTGWWCRR